MSRLTLAFAILLSCNGCLTPQWDDGRGPRPTMHLVRHAAIFTGCPDSLSVVGEIHSGVRHVPAFTDYGFRVNSAEDDTGTPLHLRSFQIFWMKVMCFEAEFSPPDPRAKAVRLDIVFATRSGVQRVVKELPLERDLEPSYVTQPGRWSPGEHRPDLSASPSGDRQPHLQGGDPECGTLIKPVESGRGGE